MRWDEHGWDLFGPAQLMDVRGGIDANGKIVAYDFTALSQPASELPDRPEELLGEPIPTPGTVRAEHARTRPRRTPSRTSG